MKSLEVKIESKYELNNWTFRSGWVVKTDLWVIGYIAEIGTY